MIEVCHWNNSFANKKCISLRQICIYAPRNMDYPMHIKFSMYIIKNVTRKIWIQQVECMIYPWKPEFDIFCQHESYENGKLKFNLFSVETQMIFSSLSPTAPSLGTGDIEMPHPTHSSVRQSVCLWPFTYYVFPWLWFSQIVYRDSGNLYSISTRFLWLWFRHMVNIGTVAFSIQYLHHSLDCGFAR